MPSLKEVRVRIASVKSTRQITSAMKMVSASKLRRAQNAILSMRPYATKLQEIMSNLSHDMEGSDEGAWAEDRGANQVLIVAITSNRGLCGAFNANVAKAVIRIIADNYRTQYDNGHVDIMCLGKKGADALKSVGMVPVETNTDIFDNLDFEHTESIAKSLMADFMDKKYDKILLVYNQFKNAAVQILQEEQYLPLVETEAEQNNNQAAEANYIFEPNKEEILEALVPSAIKIQLYKALLDSHAAEHGARMTAMHKATENADELLKNLKLSYNKARQASITSEILEIVSGAEALKG
jgi:F-type H+-transporting ATPase subunit gamma